MWTIPVCCEFKKMFQDKKNSLQSDIRMSGCSPTTPQSVSQTDRQPSTADPLYFFNENGCGFLVQASSTASGYRKPTHVTQESMATTYPGIAYMSSSGAETAVSRKIQIMGKRSRCVVRHGFLTGRGLILAAELDITSYLFSFLLFFSFLFVISHP